MSQITILMADDHPIFRNGMRSWLEEQPDFEVIAAVSNGSDALEQTTQLQPDILLLDIEMPGMAGAKVAEELASRGVRTRILVLSAFDDEAYISDLLAKGIAGYLTKEEAGEVVVDAIRQVAQGLDGWLSRTVRSRLMALHRPPTSDVLLSRREVDVLKLLASGLSNKEIASSLNISINTVKNHLANIYPKLGVHTRVEALLAIQKSGLEKLAGFQDFKLPQR